jgi:hypothetical protein
MWAYSRQDPSNELSSVLQAFRRLLAYPLIRHFTLVDSIWNTQHWKSVSAVGPLLQALDSATTCVCVDSRRRGFRLHWTWLGRHFRFARNLVRAFQVFCIKEYVRYLRL